MNDPNDIDGLNGPNGLNDFNRAPKTFQALPEIFQRFVGQVLTFEEKEHKIGGKTYRLPEKTADTEKLLREIYEVAAENNLKLYVQTPDEVTTAEYDAQRMNIRLHPNKKGEFTIPNEFHYG